MSALGFKTDRIEAEFKEFRLNHHLRAVLLEVSWYMRLRWDKIIVITCLYRTPDENLAVKGNPLSAHLDWRAADLRVSNLRPVEVTDMVTHMRSLWAEDMLHIKVHGEGANVHCHININHGWARSHPAA